MTPPAAAPHTASPSDEVAAAVPVLTADRPVFPHAQPAAGDASIMAERDHDLGLLCDRLDTLTRQLGRLVARMDAGRDTGAATAAAADDPVGAAIAEIAARQRMLAEAEPDGPTMFPPANSAAVSASAGEADQAAPAGHPPDISGLEQHLKLITKQLEILRSPCHAEELAAELRQELTGIAKTLEILMPRSTFAALEQEMHTLNDRLDASRDASVEMSAFAKLEQSVAEIRDAIANLAPVELNEAVRTLSHKVDQISGGNVDPLTLQQLDAATNSLRSIVTQVASGDVLTVLLNEVRELGEKIDRRLPVASEATVASLDRDLLLALEREVSGIAATLNAKAERAPAPGIEPLIESIVHRLDRFDLLADDETVLAPIKAQISELGEKIDRFHPPPADTMVLAPLETQLGQLAEKIERLQPSPGDAAALAPLEAQLGQLNDAIERMNAPGMEHEVLAALDERMRAIAMKLDRLEENTPARADIGPLEQRIAELADKLVASEARLGNLQAIEQGMAELIARLDEIRRAAGVDIQPEARPADPPATAGPTSDRGLDSEPQAIVPEPQAVQAVPWPRSSVNDVPAAQSARGRPRSRSAHAPEDAGFSMPAERMEQAKLASPAPIGSPADALDLPPDAPIEPGSGPPRYRGGRSASERIAVSQAMLGPLPADRTDGAGARPNFIMAARRAAQAANEQYPPSDAGSDDTAAGAAGKALAKRVKSLFVTTSLVLLAFGGTAVMFSATDLLTLMGKRPVELASPAPTAAAVPQRSATNVMSVANSPATLHAATGAPAAAGRANADTAIPVNPPAGEGKRHTERLPALASADTTGSVSLPRATKLQPVPAAQPVTPDRAALWSDPLPPALKTKALVAGIEARNPGAAYEIALRYAEGRGTEADMAAAAVWFARAAEGGIAPAQFRLGGMYEKGLGVKKDIEQARRFYLAAADRGNASAMHNLAVLYAEGADGRPEFAAAVKWFRKAADHGVVDSQYNAAVLLARGIGIEQDLGEAFKWFAVAANGGDKDAAKKRDEIGERLDAQTLAAARLAATMFTLIPQPDDATTVHAPASGWDDVSVAPPKPRSRARQHGAQSAHL